MPNLRTPPRILPSLGALAALLEAGERVFLPGSTGEPPGLTDALFHADATPLQVMSSFIPGVNIMPVERFPSGTTASSMFAHYSVPSAQARGITRHLPMSYGAFVQFLRGSLLFDTCIVHVSPPDLDGYCSLGPAVEFTPIAAAKSRRVFAVINQRLPRLPASASMHISQFAALTEIDAPLRTYEVGAPSTEAEIIAGAVAHFITDDATVQIGLGKVPDALMAKLRDRRRLKLYSGMLSDGARVLAECGALDAEFAHTCCVQLGSLGYYSWLAERPDFAVRGAEFTHAVPVLADLRGFVAVNSAVSVDLFGQANLEMLGGRMVSGCGGAPDFTRGAILSDGGISIIALPSTAGNDQSRIVPQIDGITTVPRTDVHVVVTEQGVADLRGLSTIERAARLIAIAAPRHRPALSDRWQEIAKRL